MEETTACCLPDMPIWEAARAMRDHNLRAPPEEAWDLENLAVR